MNALRTITLAVVSGVTLLGGAPDVTQAQDLEQARSRANSDDAQSIEEAFFHAEARATVIDHVEPNDLAVGGRTFRVKRNPSGTGCFVYEPQTRFGGVTRQLVWWVSDDGTGYAVNGAAKTVTPTLRFSQGQPVQPAHQVVAYVFSGEPLAELPEAPAPNSEGGFTVLEYHAYRGVIDTPMSVAEDQAHARVGRCLGLTATQVSEATDKVQRILFNNRWMGRPDNEVTRATDWNGHAARAAC